MSLRLTAGSRVARLLAATGLLAAVTGAAGTSAASAATFTTTLNYQCNFPLLRPQPLSLKITADLPASVPVNTPTGAFSIKATAQVNAASADGLRAVGTTTIEGTATASSAITLPGGIEIPLDVPTTVPKMTLPTSGAFSTDANGSTPSIKLPKTGTATITVGDVVLTLTPRLSDGTLTGLDTFETECIQVPGQNTTLATIQVTPTSTSTPTPTPTPTPTRTATPTPTPTSTGPTPTPTPKPGVKYSYNLTGSASLKTLTKGSLPLTGTADATLQLATGDFSAALAFNQSKGSLVALGFLPVQASIAIVPQGDATGTLNLSTNVLNANAKVRIKIPLVTLFGLQLAGGSGCQAKNVTNIALKSPGAFSPLDGGSLSGTFTISDLTNCGALTGIVSPLTAGSGNAIALKLTPKTTA